MRVGVAHLTAGGFSGGYRKYLRELLPLLRSHRSITSLREFVPEAARTRVDISADAQFFAGYRALQRGIDSFGADVVFFPTQRWVPCGTVPTVVMIRNMEPYLSPVSGLPITEGARNIARRIAANRACRRATRVIAVSQFVKQYAVDRIGVPADKIGVVYHGVSPVQQDALASDERDGQGSTAFVIAGSIRPARGIDEVVDAVARERTQGRSHKVVVVGAPDEATKGYFRRLERRVVAAGLHDAVLFVGQKSPSELVTHIRQSGGVLIPTWAEACPNVALEAMAQGALVVSTTQPPMPEFFEDAAIYFQPRDAASIASALRAAAELSGSTRMKMSIAARQRASEFTWERTADATVAELAVAAATR